MHKLMLLPGDGIGPEVTNAAVKVIKHAAEKFNVDLDFKEGKIGGASYNEYGTPLTDDTLSECYSADIIFLGAVGGPDWEDLPHHLKPEAALLKLRKSLGLFANLRPAKVFSSMLSASSLKEDVLRGTDVLILRELTGGIYFGEPRAIKDDQAFNTMVYQQNEIERIASLAFKLAAQRKGRVTSVDKANVLEVSQYWRSVVSKVHQEYSNIELRNMYVDNAAMQIVRDPRQFDLILTSNLFGDILSDIAAMITGSLGMLPSASIGSNYAMYEPVHGSAPDIAGKNKANPIAAILSASMMFKYSLQMDKISDIIETAVNRVLKKGMRTEDINSDGMTIVSTDQMTSAIIAEFDNIFNEEALQVFTL